MVNKISQVTSKLILNSQGQKAVECTVTLDNGESGTFAPPAGTSIGKYEAHVVSAEHALEQSKKITPELLKMGNIDQTSLDEYLKKQEGLGANATLAASVSFAIANNTLALDKADMKRLAFHMPKMMVLFFEGGVHASSKVSFQEFFGIYDDIFVAAQDFKNMKIELEESGHFVNFGMEGALVSEKLDDEIIFKLMRDKKLGLDIGGQYLKESNLDIMELPSRYTLFSIEDHYPEDDIDKWRNFYKKWGDKLIVIGDDLTVTNKDRIKEFANNAINAVIIKPNQQRTLTDTLDAVETAKKEGLKIIVSHRSGETNQTFVVDLAIAVEADFVKFGAPVRGERVAKYNRLLELTNS